MSGGRGDSPWPSPPVNGGEVILQLLQKPPHHPRTPPQQQQQPPNPSGGSGAAFSPQTPTLTHDPAVAAVGPTLPSFQQFPTSSRDLPYNFPRGILQNSNPNPNRSSQPKPPGFNHSYHNQNTQFTHQNSQFGHQNSGRDARELEVFSPNTGPHSADPRDLIFGSLSRENRNNERSYDGNSGRDLAPGGKFEGLGNRRLNDLEAGFRNSLDIDRNSPATSSAYRHHRNDHHHHGGNHRPVTPSPRPPPGFSHKPKGKEIGQSRELNHQGFSSIGHRERNFLFQQRRDQRDVWDEMDPTERVDQLDHPGPPAGSNLRGVSASEVEESMLALHSETGKDGKKIGSWRQDKARRDGQSHVDLNDPTKLLIDIEGPEDELDDKNGKKKHPNSRDKDYRSDTRGQRTLGQRMRNFKSQIECRGDINSLNAPLLAIFKSLIPPEEEKAKQKQLLTLLEKHVSKEWPEARLYLYGSCANSFGVSKSDIDVCLAIGDAEVNKSEVLLKLAEILEADNLQNVQALTRARVPIVKLFDPVTGISCDICINNLLAVVNTKLLREYAEIDERLQQLAFIVKYWAKRRGVNETYRGTLSSYAYVLMCIHFLQMRRPAILPCLQGMETTYAVTVDNVDCAYFDQVEKLHGFGIRNRESIAQLVWAFFNYWAYCHDYASDVISVRTGSILSKRAKDWTRRIGNDRHLICIEDPLETSHDLGRVVDKFSIKVLREEFERAAEILQYDPNPCVTLFEPYAPS